MVVSDKRKPKKHRSTHTFVQWFLMNSVDYNKSAMLREKVAKNYRSQNCIKVNIQSR